MAPLPSRFAAATSPTLPHDVSPCLPFPGLAPTHPRWSAASRSRYVPFLGKCPVRLFDSRPTFPLLRASFPDLLYSRAVPGTVLGIRAATRMVSFGAVVVVVVVVLVVLQVRVCEPFPRRCEIHYRDENGIGYHHHYD